MNWPNCNARATPHAVYVPPMPIPRPQNVSLPQNTLIYQIESVWSNLTRANITRAKKKNPEKKLRRHLDSFVGEAPAGRHLSSIFALTAHKTTAASMDHNVGAAG